MNFERVYKILNKPLKKIYGVKVVGLENLPSEGGYIIASNHTSGSDPIVITLALHKPVCYMAKKELFKIPVVSSLIKAFGAYPVNRGSADTKAIKTACSLLNEKNFVGIFPQGTRYPGTDPATTSVKTGVGLIAYRSGADVIPVFLKSKNFKTKIFGKTTVIIGKPISNSELGLSEGNSTEFQNASQKIFDSICALNN